MCPALVQSNLQYINNKQGPKLSKNFFLRYCVFSFLLSVKGYKLKVPWWKNYIKTFEPKFNFCHTFFFKFQNQLYIKSSFKAVDAWEHLVDKWNFLNPQKWQKICTTFNFLLIPIGSLLHSQQWAHHPQSVHICVTNMCCTVYNYTTVYSIV